MITYILNKETFLSIKKDLDGSVFWREEDGTILVRLAIPDKHAEKLLEENALHKD